LGRYYRDIHIEGPPFAEADVKTLPIWQMWLQGNEKVPPLVRKCLNSVLKYAANRPRAIMNMQDVNDTVELPGFIYDKYAKGIICPAHFSDLVRLCLLEQYGGTWIDATVFLTDALPERILEDHFFAFRAATDNIYSAHTFISNWFISVKPRHILIKSLKEALLKYWLAEEQSLGYFVFHHMFYGMVNFHPALTRIWTTCSQESNAPPLAVWQRLAEPFDGKWFGALKQVTPIHKLTYKYSKISPGSFLDVFLNSDAMG
jgi:hypothetical protein